jgi:hypothetical protein
MGSRVEALGVESRCESDSPALPEPAPTAVAHYCSSSAIKPGLRERLLHADFVQYMHANCY